MPSALSMHGLPPRSLRHWLTLMAVAWGFLSNAIGASGQEVKLNWAEKMFSARSHNFGTVGRSQAVEHTIDITNLYKEVVTISEVSSSCTCIAPSIEQRSLPSQGVTQLRLKLDTDRFSYQRNVTVKVRMSFNGGGERIVLIPISAFIDPNRPAFVAKPAPAVVEPVKTELSWADKMFAARKHEFGGVARGTEVRHAIAITNPNVETVTITAIESSSPCVQASADNLSIASRATSQLELTLDTLASYGKCEGTVTVTLTFDNSNFKQVRVPVTAYIRRDVVIQPSVVDFGIVPPNSEATKKLTINYAGRESWTIREVRVPNPMVKTELNLLRRNGGLVDYELIVKCQTGAAENDLQEQIVLVTDDAVNSQLPLVVRGEVFNEFQITPEVVKLGTLQPGVASKVSFAVKGRKPFIIDKVESDTNRDCFQVSLTPTERPIQIVNMTVTPPNQPGAFEEGFTLTIAGRSVPLTFRAVGTIEAAPSTPAPEVKPEVAAPEAKPGEPATPEPTPPAEPAPAGDAPTTPETPADESPKTDTPPSETPPADSGPEPTTPELNSVRDL